MSDNHIILGTKYVGGKAAKYNARRENKKKWKDEHDFIFENMATFKAGTTVLDCPVGTGRLLPFFAQKKFKVTGVDVVQDMLDEARKVDKKVTLELGDATKLRFKDNEFDVVVCLRLFHLVEQQTVNTLLKELSRVASHSLILTIQLGKEYYEGEDTATHVDAKFRALLKKYSWNVTAERRVTAAGWHLFRLDR